MFCVTNGFFKEGENMAIKNAKREVKREFRSLRMTPAEVDKIERLSPIAGSPGNFSKTLRWLVATFPEPADLAAQAMRGAHNA